VMLINSQELTVSGGFSASTVCNLPSVTKNEAESYKTRVSLIDVNGYINPKRIKDLGTTIANNRVVKEALQKIEQAEKDLATLDGTVTELSTTVDEVAGELSSKVDKTTYNSLAGTVSDHTTQIKQNANAISSKAEASVVDTLSGTVSGHTTQIQQNAQAISSKAEASDVDTLYGTVQTLQSEVQQTPDRISAAVRDINVGGENLLTGTDKTINIARPYEEGGHSADVVLSEGSGEYPDKWLSCKYNNASTSAVFGAYFVATGLTVGQQYTFSAEVVSWGNTVHLSVAGAHSAYSRWGNAPRRLSVTFTATATSHNLHVNCLWYGVQGYAKDIDVRKVKLEIGNKATDWSQNSGEFNAGSSVAITRDEVRFDTKLFSVHTGESGDMAIDKDGMSIGNINATKSLTAPNIATITKSQNFEVGSGRKYTTLKQVADIINNTMLIGVVRIYLTSDVYGDVTFGGLSGLGQLEIRQQGYTIHGAVTFEQCSRVYMYDTKISLPSNSSNASCLTFRGVVYAYITNGILTGKSATTSGCRSLLLANGSKVYISDTQLYNSIALMEAQYGCELITANLRGGNCTNFLYGTQFILSMRGTRPDGGLAETAAIMYPADPKTLTVNSGSAQPTPPDVTTVTLSPSDYRTNYNTSSWQSKQSQLYQGMYGSDKYRAVYWFSNSGLTGKTVKAATLTLTRVAGSGSGAATSVHLWGTPLASASGNPTTNRVDYGEIGTLTYGETKEFSIPLTAAQAFAEGSIKGFIIDPNDSVVGSREYSANYGKLESGATLKITY